MSDRPEAQPRERQGWRGQALDFAQALGHRALESPINAATQLANQYTGSHLPRLDIIGAPERNSWGTMGGTFLGTLASLAAVSRVSPTLAARMAPGAARDIITAATTGSIYGGILTETNPAEQNFGRDRLSTAAVGAISLGTASAALGRLSRSGLFGAPESRSAAESFALNGAAGATGALAGTESASILWHGRPATFSELSKNMAIAGAAGGSFGAAGRVYQGVFGLGRPAAPDVRPVDTGPASLPRLATAEAPQNLPRTLANSPGANAPRPLPRTEEAAAVASAAIETTAPAETSTAAQAAAERENTRVATRDHEEKASENSDYDQEIAPSHLDFTALDWG